MLLSSSQRRPAKLPGASVDLQSRGLSLLGTSVPDAPQPREGGAVLPREPRCLSIMINADADADARRGASPEAARPRPAQGLKKQATVVAAAGSTSQQRAARPTEQAGGRGGAGSGGRTRRSQRRT